MTPIRERDRWLRSGLGIALLAAVLVILALTYAAGSVDSRQIFILFSVNLVIALGLQTFMGLSGVVSFGHIAFMGLGAYAAGLLTTPPLLKQTSISGAPGFLRSAELGFLPATAIAIVATALLALLVGMAIVRLSGTSATIATYALLVIIQTVLVNIPSVTRGNQTFYGLPPDSTVGMALLFGIVAIGVARLFQDSTTGLLLQATREDDVGAASSGVSVFAMRLRAWVLSAAIVAAGGVLYAHLVTAISPATFSLQLTFTIVTMVILGGRGVTGAFVGAVVVTVVYQGLSQTNAQLTIGSIQTQLAVLSPIVLGALVIAVMIWRRGGILGNHEIDDLIVSGWRRLRARGKPAAAAEEGAG